MTIIERYKMQRGMEDKYSTLTNKENDIIDNYIANRMKMNNIIKEQLQEEYIKKIIDDAIKDIMK